MQKWGCSQGLVADGSLDRKIYAHDPMLLVVSVAMGRPSLTAKSGCTAQQGDQYESALHALPAFA